MKRDYENGVEKDITFFVGIEVEKTPAFGMKTLFVTGVQPCDVIQKHFDEEQCEHIITLCQTYVEGNRLEDVGNIRALYEEYGEWIDTYNGMPQSPEEYTTAWCPRLLECDG